MHISQLKMAWYTRPLIHDEAYKKEKEVFVSNLNGGTNLEICNILLIIPLTCVIFTYIHGFLMNHTSRINNVIPQIIMYPWLTYTCEFIVVVIPIILRLCDFHIVTYIVICIVLFMCLYNTRNITLSNNTNDINITNIHMMTSFNHNSNEKRHYKFLSYYRGIVMLLTCIAILGVDFPVFPRRFAKTENFGTSLMDTGVGSFVLSHALTSSRSLKPLWRKMLPLIVLGVLRLVSVRSVNYQQHYSEYGTHWNFYFTLAGVALLAHFVPTKWCRRRIGVVSVAVLLVIGHQTFLEKGGLQDFVLNSGRHSFVAANKEGIVSLVGYFAIYLFGVGASTMLQQHGKILTRLQWFQVCAILEIVPVGVLWLLHNHHVSRRLANGYYVVWILAHNAMLLGHVILLCLCTKTQWNSLVVRISECQLLVFIVANLLTGAVNMSIHTLYTPQPYATLILLVYAFIFTTFAFVYTSYFKPSSPNSSSTLSSIEKSSTQVE